MNGKRFYGLQKEIRRLIRSQGKEVNKLIEATPISKENWTAYIVELGNGNIEVEPHDVQIHQKLKYKKCPGQDRIPYKLLKYRRESLVQKLTE